MRIMPDQMAKLPEDQPDGAGLHLACIMDGNGRWAKRRGLPRTAGHTAGEEALAEVVRVASRRQIGWLTVFGFSTENWVRPPSGCDTSSVSTENSSDESRS